MTRDQLKEALDEMTKKKKDAEIDEYCAWHAWQALEYQHLPAAEWYMLYVEPSGGVGLLGQIGAETKISIEWRPRGKG